MFIGISGLIGVGKSTLTKDLAAELDRRSAERVAQASTFMGHTPPVISPPWKPYYEPVKSNPYLEDFYQDMARWTFPMQMFLMCKRYQQHQELIWDPCHQEGGGVVQDRTIYEDTIFARMHYEDGVMDERDYATYIGHFNMMRRFLQYPDIILYLRVSPEIAMQRIMERARGAESGMQMSYLEALNEGYEKFIEEMARYTLVIELDWSEYMPASEVADLIEKRADQNQDFLKSIRRL